MSHYANLLALLADDFLLDLNAVKDLLKFSIFWAATSATFNSLWIGRYLVSEELFPKILLFAGIASNCSSVGFYSIT